MKRFLLFLGNNYYPCGGMEDFKGDFDTLVDALKYSTRQDIDGWDWIQIYDTQTRTMAHKR